MAAAQAVESGHALRAAALLAVLVTAKAITLAGRQLPLSAWSPFAFFWQDVAVALIFFGCDRALRRPRVAWAAYAAVAAYAALNVPVVRVLSTPLTWTMMRAARGPLAGAVQHSVTAANIAAMAAPLLVAAALPLMVARRRVRIERWAIAAAIVFVAAGMLGTSRVSTLGLHRNAVGTLVETALPRVTPAAANDDWRSSPFAQTAVDDLTGLRGTMRGRNVVLVVLESTGSRHLRTYGSTRDPMPNLTALARSAIVGERAYAVYPESIKGLFATLCSRYPAFDTAPEVYARVPCAPLPAILRSAGYKTALFHSGRFGYLGMPAIIEQRGFDVLEDAGAIGGQVDSSFGIDDASTVRRLLDWIASVKDDRFFATYLPIAGHHPYEATRPGPFPGRDDFTRYLNTLHESDEALGLLLDGLRRLGVEARTMVVVVGDHGEAFGEHPGNFAHTLFIHEENVRVPFVITAPGAITRERRIQRAISSVDVAPTITDLLGLPAERLHQGTSWLQPEPRMALFFTDYSLGWLGLADGCWKYLYEIDAGRSRLYDVCADPGESKDRAAQAPDRVAAYRDRVRAWAAAQKDLVR